MIEEMFFKYPQVNYICLHDLRLNHAVNKIKGECVVRFSPELFANMLDIPRFVFKNDYTTIKPLHKDEIGCVEGVFHMVPDGQIVYVDI